MIVYADTSALVKRYVHEPASEEFFNLLEQAEIVGTTAVAQVEMASALGKAIRLKWVERKAALQSWQDFLIHWQSIAHINLGTGIIERAAGLAWQHELRGYDAVHLASALVWQENLNTPILFATFDRDLWKAVKNERLQVWPQALD